MPDIEEIVKKYPVPIIGGGAVLVLVIIMAGNKKPAKQYSFTATGEPTDPTGAPGVSYATSDQLAQLAAMLREEIRNGWQGGPPPRRDPPEEGGGGRPPVPPRPIRGGPPEEGGGEGGPINPVAPRLYPKELGSGGQWGTHGGWGGYFFNNIPNSPPGSWIYTGGRYFVPYPFRYGG